MTHIAYKGSSRKSHRAIHKYQTRWRVYVDLDEQQREAVEHVSRPLKVEAGPGSGKTRVIVEKVDRLVADGLSQDSILCVTFTKKAAGEMSERLQEMGIGEVKVETIHSFCLEILQENYLKTGITEKTRQFSNLARLVWCIRNSEKFGLDPEVIRMDRNPTGLYAPMMSAVSLAKRELISPQDLERHVQAGPAKPEQQDWFDQLAELSKVYRAYDTYKQEKNLVDYDDMVAVAVKLLQQDRTVMERYQQKYRHILVDEYQDNNYAQFQLIKLLAGSEGITVVGDADQSIMGFQGAFGGIFDEFTVAYPAAKTIHLKRNYRCSAAISRLAASLLAAEPHRKSSPTIPVEGASGPVDVVVAADEEAERLFVAEEIRKLGVPWRNVAVLCRTNKACERFAKTLHSQGIPAALAGAGNLMRNAAAVEVISLLKTADSPQTAGMEISWILKRRGIHEYNIAEINQMAKQKTEQGSLDDHVFEVIQKYSGSDQDTEIREIGRHLQEMIKEAQTAYLTDMLHRIMMEYSELYRRSANSDGHEAARNLAVLNSIYRMAEDYQRHYYGERLSGFVDYLGVADELDTYDPDNNAEENETGDAVSVLTMHKSKGKEFGAVFVTGLYEGGMPNKWRKREFDMPADLLQGSGREPDSAELHAHENRNLLYVAMTRAKDNLYLSYPRMVGDAAKERKPSSFLEQMQSGITDGIVRVREYSSRAQSVPAVQDPLTVAKYRIQEEACGAIRESRVEAAAVKLAELAKILHTERGEATGPDPVASLAMAMSGAGEPALRSRVFLIQPETLKLSATKIKSYQQCPLRFKYMALLRVPDRPSVSLIKGSIIHQVLDTLGKERLEGREPDTDAGIRRAHQLWENARQIHEGSKSEKVATDMSKIIQKYAEWEGSSTNELVETEAWFDTRIGDIRYTGKMDRVEKNPSGGYEIVDFKTGTSILTKKETVLDPQLNIYAAAAQARYGRLPDRVSLVYLERNNAIREYMVTPESLEEGLKTVRATVQNILDEKFGPTAGYHCRWCPYRSICPAMVDGLGD